MSFELFLIVILAGLIIWNNYHITLLNNRQDAFYQWMKDCSKHDEKIIEDFNNKITKLEKRIEFLEQQQMKRRQKDDEY